MSSPAPRSDRVESDSASHLIRASNHADFAGDSLQRKGNGSSGPTAKRTNITRARVENIRSQLNERQGAVLADVGRLDVVTGQQIQRLHYGPSAAGARLARKQLGQMVDWQVLARRERRIGGVRAGSAGYVYTAGLVGQRLLDPGRSRYFPRWTPRPSFLRHALAVSELYVRLREIERANPMELVDYDTEPTCWRSYFGPGGARSILKPDSLAVVGVGDLEFRYFVEVDCGTEHRPKIVTKAKAYVRYRRSGREQAETGIFPFVLWVAPDSERAAFLIDALSTLPAEDWQLFQVTTADRAADKIADGAAEPISNRKEVT